MYSDHEVETGANDCYLSLVKYSRALLGLISFTSYLHTLSERQFAPPSQPQNVALICYDLHLVLICIATAMTKIAEIIIFNIKTYIKYSRPMSKMQYFGDFAYTISLDLYY